MSSIEEFINKIKDFLVNYQHSIKIIYSNANFFFAFYTDEDKRIILKHFHYIIKGAFFNSGTIVGTFYDSLSKVLIDKKILDHVYTFVLKKVYDDNEIYYEIYTYTKVEFSVNIIKRYWKKYRWDYLRNLAAWKYHPSKIDFSV